MVFKIVSMEYMYVMVIFYLQLKGVLAAVDATKEKRLGEEYKIQGFPTVKYFKYVNFYV